MFTKHDVEWAAEEVVRQGATPMHVPYLLNALTRARTYMEDEQEIDLQTMLDLVRDVQNNERLWFREIPVTFANGTRGLEPSLIIRALINLVEATEIEPFEFYLEFEKIHPFIDGNGRVGSVLYNWMIGTLDAPITPPDAFG